MVLLVLPCVITDKILMYIQIYNNFIFFKKYQKNLDIPLEKIEKDAFQKHPFLFSPLLLMSSPVADTSV